MRVCSTALGGCGKVHDGKRWRCRDCARAHDRARRPDGNPYSTLGHQAFREAVLTRDPICVICMRARATVADHFPDERRDLVAQGLDPNDPARGRGLCTPCHNRKTALTASGWDAESRRFGR